MIHNTESVHVVIKERWMAVMRDEKIKAAEYLVSLHQSNNSGESSSGQKVVSDNAINSVYSFICHDI